METDSLYRNAAGFARAKGDRRKPFGEGLQYAGFGKAGSVQPETAPAKST